MALLRAVMVLRLAVRGEEGGEGSTQRQDTEVTEHAAARTGYGHRLDKTIESNGIHDGSWRDDRETEMIGAVSETEAREASDIS